VLEKKINGRVGSKRKELDYEELRNLYYSLAIIMRGIKTIRMGVAGRVACTSELGT
jgi:hypothetical protein